MADTISAYDPERESLVSVPASAAKQLEDAGYKTGPLAELEARKQGWEGKVAAAFMGAGNAASLGALNAYLPKSLQALADQVNEAHPGYAAAGDIVGSIPRTINPLTNIAGSAIQGGMTALNEASKHSHPITAERILQGALWDAALAGVGEGVGAGFKAIAPGAKRALNKLARIMPRTVEGAAAGFLPESMRRAGEIAGALGHNPITGVVGAAAAADDVAIGLVNHLDAVNRSIDKIVAPVTEGVGNTVKALLTHAGNAKAMSLSQNVDKAYDAASGAVQQMSANPELVQHSLDTQYQHGFNEYPMAYAGAVQKLHEANYILNGKLPRNPNDPTLLNDYRVPRSFKMAWLHLFNSIHDPAAGLANPTPELIEVYEQIHPETLRQVRTQLVGALQGPEAVRALSPAQARKISIILGGPIRPETSKQFIANMQSTFAEAAQPAPAPNAAPPAKIANTAATMDAPMLLQNQIGM